MIKEKFAQKTVGFYLALAAAVVALVGLIIFAVYNGQGGEKNTWVVVTLLLGIALEIVLFFYDGTFGDIIATLPPMLFAVAMCLTILGGYGNIADHIEGNIVMWGKWELAGLNIAMVVVLLVAIVVSVVSCFVKRQKDQ